MKMKILAATLLISMTNVANAGFFDSLFGSEEAAPAAEVKAQVTSAAKTEASSTISTATSMVKGLLPSLTKELGVTNAQAEGGMGSIMQLAKSSLSSAEFGKLSGGVPDMSSLLAAVPQLSSASGGGLTDMLSNAGGLASSLSSMAQLTKQFEALGLSPDMISKFTSIAMSYFSGDSSTSGLLQKGLSAILG